MNARRIEPPDDDENDMAALGRAMKAERQERHANWKAENTNLIRSSGLTFESRNNGESLIFRSLGKPAVAFYPSTGRWHVPKLGRTMGGHAAKFVAWYAGANA